MDEMSGTHSYFDQRAIFAVNLNQKPEKQFLILKNQTDNYTFNVDKLMSTVLKRPEEKSLL